MDTLENHGQNNKKVLVDFEYFIQLAIQKNITWSTLIFFLHDLAPTLEKSKQVIETLVQELEKWVLKVENNESINDVTEMLDDNEKQAKFKMQVDRQNLVCHLVFENWLAFH